MQMKEISSSPTFMLVAGELSGDILGAGLIKSLKQEFRNVEFFGVGGPLMIAEGLESLVPIETLSVMGLVEVIGHLPKLLALKKNLVFEAEKRMPVAFIGIDSPDFNLRMAESIKKIGIATFHYVSPSIWVWREKRVFKIAKSVDKVLCLFPFEVELYKKHKVDAVCVGHRLADEIPLMPNTEKAREVLGVPEQSEMLAILPGSRKSELSRLLSIYLQTAILLLNDKPLLEFYIPAINSFAYQFIEAAIEKLPNDVQDKFHIVDRDSRLVMEAANAVLLASGTATLEAMLLKKPMVVAYQFSFITAYIATKVVKTPYFSLPNILANKKIVPEVFQKDVTPENLHTLVLKSLTLGKDRSLQREYLQIHHSLRLNADKTATKAILDKLVSTL